MKQMNTLDPEWERIDLLGSSLSSIRRGADIAASVENRLQDLQQQVEQLRCKPPWQNIVRECHLAPLDQDILACSVAPEAEPRLGWMYQELQPGIGSTYPTPALIREMLFMQPDEAATFRRRLMRGSPLMKSGLLKPHSSQNYQPIQPSHRASSALLGEGSSDSPGIPGAVSMESGAGWEELVLPKPSLQAIREFMLWVTHRTRVMQDWQGRVGGGPVALFAGPSGTGKTFAAEVLATSLRRPLYRVDLGLLVSKYIGETEKNLNGLFDAAALREIVLLFDEADSLFGKRGEVREARDRYANMEVSHLLTRIEQHRGPCVLTSNLRNHLDPAFARRFQMVIEFPRPDSVARAKLWQLHIPLKAPRDDDVEMAMLGEEMNLTGGQIRNAALHAAFLAAGEECPIALGHIARAVWTELGKEGGEMMVTSLGLLADYLPEEVRHAAY